MRVLIAPDSFGGTMTAARAAEAIAAGWHRARPGDALTLRPMSDGGPGFLDVMPGERTSLTVEGPTGEPVVASWKLDGRTAYVESAQACGLQLSPRREPGVMTTYGVGQLVAAAVEHGATRVVIGLGGSVSNDGGAGMLAALGIRREDVDGRPLAPGGAALAQAHRLVGHPPDVVLVAATDVDNPLLGPQGATHVFAPQKGATPSQLEPLDKALGHWADLLEDHLGVRARDEPGAGAAGGLGFAILALGGTRVSGVEVVADALRLNAADHDIVLTGEGSFDVQSLRGKVVSGVARRAQAAGVPCVVLAGRAEVGDRQRAAHGIDGAYSLVELVGLERALQAPDESLATLAAGVAREWGV